MAELARPIIVRALRVALLALTGCSVVLDTKQDQCSVDTDCGSFDSLASNGHMSCQAGVCTDLGLGPSECVAGGPKTQDDFANRCTTAKWIKFDNCKIGLCD